MYASDSSENFVEVTYRSYLSKYLTIDLNVKTLLLFIPQQRRKNQSLIT